VPVANSPKRTRNHYLSVLHWYESSKFMPARPDLRDAVLHCPTGKEARKFAKSKQAVWRSDWNLVRHSVLVAGLGFLCLDRPDLKLLDVPADELVELLASTKESTSFLWDCVARFQVWGLGPRIATFGAAAAPAGVVGKKLSKVVQNKPSWTLVSLCNSHAAWQVHDWALSHYVPVKYVGQPNLRTTSSVLEALVENSSHLVVFEARGAKRADGVIRAARDKKVPVALELYSAEQQL
jgi:predicted NAD-dependent protein-ADP-ribosyltransferase YbiA (DUF1768 family)